MFVTGLIYVAIVGLWAAVLIPMWLRRHDDGEAQRAERHQEAMGILARFRGDGSGYATPARRAARRRRSILATLIALTVAGATAWLLQVTGPWAVVTPALILLVFLASAAWATRAATRRSEAYERAAARRRDRREAPVVEEQPASRTHRTEVIARPAATTPARRRPAVAQAQWDQVFDQTA